jgi:hypothetical protein
MKLTHTKVRSKEEIQQMKDLKLYLKGYEDGIAFERGKNDRNMATKIQG